MTINEELELALKKLKDNESHLLVLKAGLNSITENINEIEKKRIFLCEDYQKLKLESFSTDQEIYDYILEFNNGSNYIFNNVDKYLPKGCSVSGLIVGNNQRKIILDIDFEPSKNEEKIEKIFSHIQNTNLNMDFSRNIISSNTDGKYITLISTDTNKSYSLIYANDIDAYYLVRNNDIVAICKTINSVLENLNLHINDNKNISCSENFL